MAPIAMTLSDFEGHFSCLNRFYISHLGKYSIGYVAYFNWCIEKTLLQQIANNKWFKAYQAASFPMTLSDFQGHSLITGLFKYDFSYSYAAVDKNSDERCAVPL